VGIKRTSIKTEKLFGLSTLVLVLLVFSLFTSVAQQKNNELPKPRNGNTYVVAHRGAHIGIPENTIPAFQKAIDLGCDFVEIDVRKTKDEKLVSVHNSTVDAYVNGITGKVNEFTLAELKAMNIGERVGQEWENTRIPTVEEILQLCQGKIGIYLDLKEPHIEELVSLLKKYNMERDVIWYIPASYIDLIKEVKQLCKECLPIPDPGEEKNIARIVELVHPGMLATDMGALSKNFVKTAHLFNTKVIVDEKKGSKEEWSKILEWGTDGIQTDDPETLIKFLNQQEK